MRNQHFNHCATQPHDIYLLKVQLKTSEKFHNELEG